MRVMTFKRPSVVAALAQLSALLEQYPTIGQADAAREMHRGMRQTGRLLDELARRADLAGPSAPKRGRGGARVPPRPFTTRDALERLVDVAEYMAAHPGATTRAIGAALGISQTTAHRYMLELARMPAPPVRPAPLPKPAPVVRAPSTWLSALGA